MPSDSVSCSVDNDYTVDAQMDRRLLSTAVSRRHRARNLNFDNRTEAADDTDTFIRRCGFCCEFTCTEYVLCFHIRN